MEKGNYWGGVGRKDEQIFVIKTTIDEIIVKMEIADWIEEKGVE